MNSFFAIVCIFGTVLAICRAAAMVAVEDGQYSSGTPTDSYAKSPVLLHAMNQQDTKDQSAIASLSISSTTGQSGLGNASSVSNSSSDPSLAVLPPSKGTGNVKSCTRVYMPVCGSDGKTYNNQCELELAQLSATGLTKATDGSC